MRTFAILAASAFALAACDPGLGQGPSLEETYSEVQPEMIKAALTDVLAHERRSEDTARDSWWSEPLDFFQL